MRTKKIKRYRDIFRLLMRYGRSDLVTRLRKGTDIHGATGDVNEPKRLAADLQALGPTFVKLGQLLSTQVEYLPDEYRNALDELQEGVSPISIEEVRDTVSRELGREIASVFSRFDPHPLASASLAQVHRAELFDGTQVAVKVQRADIKDIILQDLEIFSEITHILDRTVPKTRGLRLPEVIPVLRDTLIRELDFHQESMNLKALAVALKEFDRILIPQPFQELTTELVLTMELIDGKKITNLTPAERESIDGDRMVEDLLKAYMQQILKNGMVHVDPHPGNLHVTPAGNLVILDLGMVTHVSQEMRTIYAELFAAVGDGRGGDAADLALRLGEREADFDAFKWRNSVSGLVAQYQNTTLESIPVGRLMLQMSEIASQCGVRRPIEFSILGSTLLKLDRVIKLLAPDYNPNDFMRRHAPRFLLGQMSDAVSMGKAFTTFVESAELFSSLPRHGNDILSMLKQNQLQFKVDAIDESRLITGIQKIANRITMGLVVASMIIGAALLTNVETDFTIFGYPGVAMILFLVAVVFGAAQLVDILISDEHRPKRIKHGPKR